jgi:hypothetical protein
MHSVIAQLPAEVKAQARRRRARRVLTAVVMGTVVGAYTFGALAARVSDKNDVLPVSIEGLLLGAAFTLASLPVGWSILARVVIPMPTLLLYLSVFLGRSPPLPFAAALALALVHAVALTALSASLAERPSGSLLGSRR